MPRRFHDIQAVIAILFMLILALILPTKVHGQCSIEGAVVGSADSARPDLGLYEYTLEFEWDTGTSRRMLELAMFVDDVSRGCTCDQLRTAVTPGDTVGYSIGSASKCLVYFESEFMCESMPPYAGGMRLMRFMQIDAQAFAPDSTGTGVFTFYSDYPPVPIATSSLHLVDALEDLACTGGVVGEFPGLPCDPSPAGRRSWGAVKSIYRR